MAGTVIDSSVPDDIVDIVEEETEIEDVEAQQAAEAAEWERQARVQGWRPLTEYRGPAGGWVDAKTFVERGRDFVPFIKKQLTDSRAENANLKGEITGLRTSVEEMRADMQRYLDFARRSGKEAYDRAIADMKVQQRDAVAAGDTATYDQVAERIAKMEEVREVPDEAPPARAPAPTPAVQRDPVIETFINENPWFMSDPVLNAAMVAEDKAVTAEFPGMARVDQLQSAKEAVMQRHPRKFGIVEEPAPQPQRRAPSAPLAPTPPTRPTARKGIDSIIDPAERREMRDGFNRAKRNTPDITEEEYLAVARNPHADVLSVMDDNKTSRRTRK